METSGTATSHHAPPAAVDCRGSVSTTTTLVRSAARAHASAARSPPSVPAFSACAPALRARYEYLGVGFFDLAPEAVEVAPGRIDAPQRPGKPLLLPLLVGFGEPIDFPFANCRNYEGIKRMMPRVIDTLSVHLLQ